MSGNQPERLSPEIFNIDVKGIIRGIYTDEYFNNARKVLTELSRRKIHFQGNLPEALLGRVKEVGVFPGDMVVDMQVFTRRKPWSLVCGVDYALALLKYCTGFVDKAQRFKNTSAKLEVRAIFDGEKIEPWLPVMRICGRYRDFAILETLYLGVLTRATRVATNVYKALAAGRGKPVFFFPARYDIYQTQPLDGYAYKIAVDAYNREHGTNTPVLVSTEAQAIWWQGKGGGTVSHSFILCFLRDTLEAMKHFAEILPVEIKRIALVDTNNDCVGDSLQVARYFFRRFMELKEQGKFEEAEKFRLAGVRLDTANNLRDISVAPTGDPAEDNGVCPRLVEIVRRALDEEAEKSEIPDPWRAEAGSYFRNIKIVVSAGFDPERIRLFEERAVPADIYGIGSYFFDDEVNDFTADIVRVKIGTQWFDLAKEGRHQLEHPQLQKVVL